MPDENSKKDADMNEDASGFKALVDSYMYKMPKKGDIIRGKVMSASKSEVRLDIDGIMTGLIRGNELYSEASEYADLKPGDEIEATVTEVENEFGELELSFRHVGQEKAWEQMMDAYEHKKNIPVKILNANKGGLLVSFKQICGFLPVSQLSPENYPRVEGGDKGKILEKLKSFVGREIEVRPITIEIKDEKIIFSEKEAWVEKRHDIISKYKIGTVVEGEITAVTDFGVFIKFGENLEGLIHISELAWQRIENPASLYRVGESIKAEIIDMEGSKVFLSAKKLISDPWGNADKKYKVGQIVKGRILKVNPFGLFVGLDADIHGLAHINALEISPGQKIQDNYKSGEEKDFKIISIEPKEHRLGLEIAKEGEAAEPKKKRAKKESEGAADSKDPAEEKKKQPEISAPEPKERARKKPAKPAKK